MYQKKYHQGFVTEIVDIIFYFYGFFFVCCNKKNVIKIKKYSVTNSIALPNKKKLSLLRKPP